MAFVNYTTKNIAIKVVYYGPGLSGKTTNLRFIYSKMDPDSRGDLLFSSTFFLSKPALFMTSVSIFNS